MSWQLFTGRSFIAYVRFNHRQPGMFFGPAPIGVRNRDVEVRLHGGIICHSKLKSPDKNTLFLPFFYCLYRPYAVDDEVKIDV